MFKRFICISLVFVSIFIYLTYINIHIDMGFWAKRKETRGRPDLGIVECQILPMYKHAHEPSPRHAYPHQVSLQIKWPSEDKAYHFCGGSIIDEYKVLTTASCALPCQSKDYCRLVGGAHNLEVTEDTQQIRDVMDVKIHPDFNGTNYNFAILYTDTKWEYNDVVKPIGLSLQDPKSQCVATGWGYHKMLRQVYLTVPYQQCTEIYGSSLSNHTICVYCAQGKDFVEYGGPVMCEDGLLAGVGSSADPPCGTTESPAGFSRVTLVREWIKSV